MKILIINTVPTEKNGITGVIFNYLGKMDAPDLFIDLLSPNAPANIYLNEVNNKGGNVYVLPRLDGIIKYWINLIRLIRRNKYDAVHIHGNSHTVVLELSAALIGGCHSRIVHSHNTTCSNHIIHTFLKPVFNLLYTNGVACGKDAGYWMFGRRPFVVLNNGVDTEKFAFNPDMRITIRKEMGLLHDNILVGHVGLFNEQKNHAFLINVFRELYGKDDRYRLLLIGDGELRPSIERQVDEMGLKSVVYFTGSITNVADYLNSIDIILMPSLYEGLPLALVEQQANGLCCVVSDAISKEADMTGNLDFLPLTTSAEKWAEKVMSININAREDVSKKSIERIKDAGYSIHTEAKKLEKYYMEVCRNSSCN